MKIKLLIKNEMGLLISQDIQSEWSVKKDGIQFFSKLNTYLNTYIIEYNKVNTIPIQKLEAFDEDEVLLASITKN
jgi:hypothetical protein